MAGRTASAGGPRRRITALEWAVIGLALGLSVVLLLGALLPARARGRRTLERNLEIADELLREQRDIHRLRRYVHDLRYDPLTLENLLREKGALDPGDHPE